MVEPLIITLRHGGLPLLRVDTIASLLGVCKAIFNLFSAQDFVLQWMTPLFSRLKAIEQEPNHPATTNTKDYLYRFKEVEEEQRLEMLYFEETIQTDFCFASLRSLAVLSLPKTFLLHDLEERNKVLDRLNVIIIASRIDPNSPQLDISESRLTRFPSNFLETGNLPNVQYWSVVESINCMKNRIKCIPTTLMECSNLKRILFFPQETDDQDMFKHDKPRIEKKKKPSPAKTQNPPNTSPTSTQNPKKTKKDQDGGPPTKRAKLKDPKDKAPKAFLLVSNLPSSINDAKLVEIFTGCNVKSARIVKASVPRSGVVEFASKADQIRALGEKKGLLLQSPSGEAMPIEISIWSKDRVVPGEDFIKL